MAVRRKSEVQREARQILGTFVQAHGRLTKSQLREVPVNGEPRVCAENSFEVMWRVVHHPRRRTQRGSFVKPLGEKRLRLLYSVAMADRCGRTTRVVGYGRSSRSCPNDIAQECNRTTFDFHGSACGALLYRTTQRTQCGETARPEPNHATREFDRCVTIARAERLRDSAGKANRRAAISRDDRARVGASGAGVTHLDVVNVYEHGASRLVECVRAVILEVHLEGREVHRLRLPLGRITNAARDLQSR
jgi:hypothetical protein